MLFDAGLAGICVPTEYGGQGLTPAHQRALNEEMAGYEYPTRFQVPTFSPVRRGAARLRHRGAEAAAHPRHPQGRGDLDAVPLRAERRLRRRRRAHHRGARRRRVDPERLEGVDHRRLVVGLGAVPRPHELGRPEAPRPDRVHAPDPPAGHRGAPHRDAQRLQGVLPGVPDRRAGARHATASARSTTGGPSAPAGCSTSACAQLAARHASRPARSTRRRRRHRCSTSPATPAASTTRVARDLIGEVRMLDLVGDALERRVGQGIATGTMSDQASAIGRLFGGLAAHPADHHRLRARRRRRRGVDRRRRRRWPSAATTS